jgi:beta-ribofuranosylaminobenzene 5'-phosphate synthase
MKDPRLFESLEKIAGPLSPLQRILLGTDGSVTRLLELATGARVTITTLMQELEPASPVVAERLDIPPGSEVNHRIVALQDSRTGEPLIYAESYTPLSRLSPHFREDLMRADIPIGRILERHRVESRREITGMSAGPRPGPIATRFRLPGDALFLSRHYRIIHQDHPLIHIEETFPSSRFAGRGTVVVVDAPSRLHLGLLDMNGALGRVDGGIGIALRDPGLVISATLADQFHVAGGDADCRARILAAAEAVRQGLNLPGGAHFTLQTHYPGHVGLGRGTQLALATGRALCELHGIPCRARDLAHLTHRGGTSGIGTAAFEQGGFLIDGGHSFGEGWDKQVFLPSSAAGGVRPPEVAVRHPFPGHWKILVVIPEIPPGASGSKEKEIFSRHCPVPLTEVQALCHEVLVRLLPGLVEEDLDLFGSAVNRIQELGFKRVEHSLQPSLIPDLLNAIRDAGAAGAGLSSFGPTVFAFGEGNMNAMETAAREALVPTGGGSIILTTARNIGASVTPG